MLILLRILSIYHKIKNQQMYYSRVSQSLELQTSEGHNNCEHFIAETAVADTINQVIDAAISRHAKNQKFKENLKKFSSMKIVTNINEVNSLNFYESNQNFSTLKATNEPSPLYIDSLLPISADLDKENTYKLNLKKMMQSQISNISKTRRQPPQKVDKKSEYYKLDLDKGQEEEDGFTKELRRVQEQRENKERNDQRVKEMLLKQEKQKLKEKKKERQEKFSFDYNGLPVKIRSQSKNNLISKLINGDANSKTKVDKQAFNDPNPQVVDSVSLGKKKNSNGNVVKRRDEVEFQENRSLAQGVIAGVGVKYVYEGRSFQGKKKAVSTIELKRTLKDRRLNRQEFERIKATNGSSLQLFNSDADFRETKQKRSQSQANLLKSRKKKKEEIERITINNPSLRQKMLQKVNDMMQQARDESTPPLKFQYIGQTDIFNMNYLKGGSQIKSEKNIENLSTQRSLLIFPKISNINKNKSCLPKERERIKEINTVIYQIRKKFDEKLKI